MRSIFWLIFVSIFKRFLGAFWFPRPSKIELSLARRAYFEKIAVFGSGLSFHWFWDAFLIDVPLIVMPKWLPNFARKMNAFWMDSGNDFGFILVTKMLQKSHQKSIWFLAWFWIDFWFQNASIIEPKRQPDFRMVPLFSRPKTFWK